MKKIKSAPLFLTAMLGLMSMLPSAHAMLGSKLDLDSLSAAESEQVKAFLDKDVRADFQANMGERLSSFKSVTGDAPMSKETETLLLKGAYMTLQNLIQTPISETKFNKVVGGVMDKFRSYGMLPHAVTVGVLSRALVNVGPTPLLLGGNFGAEANFYIQGGKLMMTNYNLMGGQVGVGTPTLETAFYVAFCFGSCFGGNPNGWYLGMDGSASGGAGADVFIEAGIDVSSLVRQKFVEKRKFTVKDFYQASTLYMGAGYTVGISAQLGGGLYHYHQLGYDMVLANPGEHMDPSLISSHSSDINVKP